MNDYLISLIEKIIERVEIDGIPLDRNDEIYCSLKNWYENFIEKNTDDVDNDFMPI